jgi:thioredoxin-related protein
MRAACLLLAFCLAFPDLAAAEESRSGAPMVAVAHDLYDLGAQAHDRRLPILLVISQTGCPFCRQLKEEILRPMIISGEYVDKVIIREVLIDDLGPVRDFDGSKVEPGALATRYGARVTPTLLFLDHRGRELAERIVGINSLDYYGFYVDSAIHKARSGMAAN